MVEQAVEYRELDRWELHNSWRFAFVLGIRDEVYDGQLKGIGPFPSTLNEAKRLADTINFRLASDLIVNGRISLVNALRDDPALREAVYDNPNVLNRGVYFEKFGVVVQPVVTTKV